MTLRVHDLLEVIQTWPEERVECLWEMAQRLDKGGGDDESEVYVGATPGGMSLDVPPERILDALLIIAEAVAADRFVLSYAADSGFEEIQCSMADLAGCLAGIEEKLRDPSFLMEFEGGALYTGGEGCFSLAAPLTAERKHEVTRKVLRMFDTVDRVTDACRG